MAGQEGHTEKIKIAKIVNTHGVSGEVKAIPLSDFADRYASLEKVFVKRNNVYQDMRIDSVRWGKKHLLLKFQGIDTPEHAVLLKNSYVEIDQEDTVPLPEGSYYLFEIIGLEVFEVNGNRLGRIQNVLQTSANDIYVVQGEQGKELLIPALKKVVRQVDLENNRMLVELLPGLLEEEERHED